MNIKKAISVLIIVFTANVLLGQRGSDRYLTFSAAPALGFRILGDVKVPSTYKAGKVEFRDSLNKADRPGQSMNFGIQYFTKKNAFDAFSIGISYTTLTYRRVAENLKLGDWIHPQVGYITGLVQAANLSVRYDYRYRYIEAPILWHKSAEGYGNLKEFDMWYFFGFAPAVMVQDRVHIFTQGFTAQGTNTFDIKDEQVTPVRFNVFAQAGFRADYYMYKNIHGLLQPRFRMPVLPSSGGTQTVWIPQLSLDLGLIFLLDKDRKN